jgi:hypothetical protein
VKRKLLGSGLAFLLMAEIAERMKARIDKAKTSREALANLSTLGSGWSGVGLGGVLQCLPEYVALFMHRFTMLIGFGDRQVDGFVANRARNYRLSGTYH